MDDKLQRFGYLSLGRLFLYETGICLQAFLAPVKTATHAGGGLQCYADGHAAMAVWGVPGRLPCHQLVLAAAPFGGVRHSGAPGHRRSAGNSESPLM